MKETYANFFSAAQQSICRAFEELDGKETFLVDRWERTDLTGKPGGGGVTCILNAGAVFERAGVNFSKVYGVVPAEMANQLVGINDQVPLFASGVSLVIHPFSPMIPTSHANIRYLEIADKAWFGGGMDLTPYYLFEDDAAHFHRTIKTTCDKHDLSFYPKFKKWCDEYFYLPHREETRGVGGMFFDELGKADPALLLKYWAFIQDFPRCYLDAYLPIVKRRIDETWTEKEKSFQLLRRSRYVEFNLLYDRGTHFGLATSGRTESILMSLPPVVNWIYNYQPQPGTREEQLLQVLRMPREWV